MLRIPNVCADDLGESTEKISERGSELVATDEPTVVAEPPHDSIIVEDSEGNGRLSNSAGTDEGNRSEAVCETNDLLDQLVASKEDSWWWG